MRNLWNIRMTDFTASRTIPAAPPEVFEAWLDPNHPGSPWLGVKRAIVQPTIDGLFYRMHLAGDCVGGDILDQLQLPPIDPAGQHHQKQL